MSSPSEPASPQPAEPTAEDAGGHAQSDAASSAPAQPSSNKPSIRIGTQRYGVKAPPAVAKPVLPLPDSMPEPEPKTTESRSTQARDTEQRHTEQRHTEQRHTEERDTDQPAEPTRASSADEAVEPATAPGSTGSHDRDQQKRGEAPANRGEASANRTARRKENKPRAPRSVEEIPSGSKIAPPNTRGELPADLELEYLEALGGQSLDEVISTQAQSPVLELEPESRHRGRVISIHRDNVFVEIGSRQQGLLALKNFADPPEIGTVLDVMVSRFNPADGYYELTMPGGAVSVGDWSEVAEGMVVEARVTGHNKGGLECEVNRLRGFIPASQISMYRVEDLAQFVDQKLNCVVTEANPEKRNLVLSHRAVLERDKAEAKEKLLAELQPGQEREGTVRSLQPFGAFVDLGGVDGLIHISQLSWDRIKHADEVLQLGQKVKVKIQKIDPQTGKIGLGFRDLSENPWANVSRDFPARSRVKGTVSRLMEFGAFVRLAPGVEGLVHISELSHKRVFRVSDMLTEGQDVEVMVLAVDPEQQRISLSLKALEARASASEAAQSEEPDEGEAAPEPQRKRNTPLKGGVGGPATGEKFGLKW
ncbi:MAG TPA: S1 RNA-binding domain-containing protein [Pirellulales bacterium]|nr:S1 RNA-binding domain-containing protein [Pirellulales bacterium]